MGKILNHGNWKKEKGLTLAEVVVALAIVVIISVAAVSVSISTSKSFAKLGVKRFFQREVEQLTEFQLNFLKALANGVSSGFSRKEVIRKYRLESSANIQSVKKSLLKKDLIDIDGQIVTFDDSLFKLWIRSQSFYE